MLPRLEEVVDASAAAALARGMLAWVAPTEDVGKEPEVHPAVRRMCSLLEGSVDEDVDDLSLTSLAETSGLSARQLRHRFSADLGPSLESRDLHRLNVAAEGAQKFARAPRRIPDIFASPSCPPRGTRYPMKPVTPL